MLKSPAVHLARRPQPETYFTEREGLSTEASQGDSFAHALSDSRSWEERIRSTWCDGGPFGKYLVLF